MALHGHPEQLGESGASLYSISTLRLFNAHATATATATANTTPMQLSLPKQCLRHCAFVYLSVYLSISYQCVLWRFSLVTRAPFHLSSLRFPSVFHVYSFIFSFLFCFFIIFSLWQHYLIDPLNSILRYMPSSGNGIYHGTCDPRSSLSLHIIIWNISK